MKTSDPATTAAVTGDIAVVCSVLPWRGAVGGPWPGKGQVEQTLQALEQVRPLLTGLASQHALVWSGDWNHALEGPLDGSTELGRERIDDLLGELGLFAPTRYQPRGVFEINSIDHVAVPDSAASSQHVVATANGRRLSDHDAYVVTTDAL